MAPLSLSDAQLDRILAAAALLPQQKRDVFLRSVAGRVAHSKTINTTTIQDAIAFVLALHGISKGQGFARRYPNRRRRLTQAQMNLARFNKEISR